MAGEAGHSFLVRSPQDWTAAQDGFLATLRAGPLVSILLGDER